MAFNLRYFQDHGTNNYYCFVLGKPLTGRDRGGGGGGEAAEGGGRRKEEGGESAHWSIADTRGDQCGTRTHIHAHADTRGSRCKVISSLRAFVSLKTKANEKLKQAGEDATVFREVSVHPTVSKQHSHSKYSMSRGQMEIHEISQPVGMDVAPEVLIGQELRRIADSFNLSYQAPNRRRARAHRPPNNQITSIRHWISILFRR
ncbi:uncharacterized protein [Hemitrygon akajei]|uniref:uncharacterized protein n=1 Tax=Hemitrygon akajei TaxID=2704970 RepID=UPI003BFA2A85